MEIAILSVALVLLCVALFRLLVPTATSANNRHRDKGKGFGADHPFHAVAIDPVSCCCDAARSLSARRFLSEEAPSLPLSTCDAQQCQCRFIHYPDRRGGDQDRRLGPVEESEESEFWSLRNRRSFVGRRRAEQQLL